MAKWSTKRSIRKIQTNFKRWLDKSNRSFKSPNEGEILKTFRKLIYLSDSNCFVDIDNNKRYIENKSRKILIILFENQIIIIQNKQLNPAQYLSIHTYETMCQIFNSRLSKERIELENTYLDDTKSFLDHIDLLISPNFVN